LLRHCQKSTFYVLFLLCACIDKVFDSPAPMTPFESLLWTVWLPKVRSTINNDWSPEEPQPAVKLYEAWSTFLPPFIRDNMLDQLILPKVQKAVADWNPKRSKVSLRSIVFPWLPFIGLRLDDFMSDARRKVKSLLRSWLAGDNVPDDLSAWRDVSLPSSLQSPIRLNDGSGLRQGRMGHSNPQIYHSKTGHQSTNKLPYRSTKPSALHARIQTNARLASPHPSLHPFPNLRSGILP
jgi:hypothetical protein